MKRVRESDGLFYDKCIEIQRKLLHQSVVSVMGDNGDIGGESPTLPLEVTDDIDPRRSGSDEWLARLNKPTLILTA